MKAENPCLVLVDVVVEGFTQKPPLVGTQLVELPTLQETQPLVEEVLSLDNEVKAQVDKKRKMDKKGGKGPSRKGKSKKKLLLNKLRLSKLLGPNNGAEERLQR